MPRYKIKDAQGNVVNTILADLSFVQQHYPGLFEEEVDTTPVKKPKLTHRQFLKKLTTAEFKSIRQAAKTDGDVDMFMYLFERAQEVDPNDSDTIAGVQMLELKGLVAAGRAAEILA